ncbi:MAG: Ni/Fe hydrogenase subunit alpha [Gammaproteobacteria bacterium]|nr:Ni/Fe hydrogenase subunit alpha [Gammaproteobacteria bacterium]
MARVEGEGALHVRIKDGVVKDVKFRIFEPPRFFEAFLQGRLYSEAPDITARICGICPIAYMMGASQAMEDALGMAVTGPLRDLRRLIYCGEWIESHVLHAYLLHAPDFLGFEDAIRLSQHHPGVVEKALQLKKLGNRILEVIGGRAVHPVNLRVGGFYRTPRKDAIRALIGPLQWAVEASLDTVKLVGGFDFPDYHYDYTCVSLHHPDEYPITQGRLISNRGLDIAIDEFSNHIIEQHVAHSNALQGHLQGSDCYLVGPIARYNNNFEQLSDLARQAAGEAGLGRVCDNPFQSIVVRAVETLYACEEALRLAENYEEPDAPYVEPTVQAGIGHGCTEAPRGICYHRYQLDENGRILEATIVPPTSQNQLQIERDLWGVVEKNLDLPEDRLKWRCEQTIRNYDPCISCATHFLRLTVERE